MSDLEAFDPADPALPINRLATAWPRLFHGPPPRWSSCAEGWFEIVTDLCRHLDQLLTDDQAARFKVHDVKEKFGSLRFYCSLTRTCDGDGDGEGEGEGEGEFDDTDTPVPDPDAGTRRRMGALVVEAESRASTTCMKCGQHGSKDHTGGWVLTLCPVHIEERKARERREAKKRKRTDAGEPPT